MQCAFCGWEMGLGGTVDPCEIVMAFEDHLAEHVEDVIAELSRPQ